MLLTIEEQQEKYKQIANGVKMTGLRKVRSRMIAEALLRGVSERGNSMVTVERADEYAYLKFYYRGTCICTYDIGKKQYEDTATQFEHTASTQNQRDLARQAISEVFGVPCND